MPRKGSLGPGLEDRVDRLTIRARARCSDQNGQLRDLDASFRYAPDLPASNPHSRSSAIARARAWLAEQKRAMRLDRMPVGERLADVTLADWISRYIVEAEEGVDRLRREGPRVKVARHARKKGALRELSVLRQWMAEFPRLMKRQPDSVTRKQMEQAAEHLMYARVSDDGAPAVLKPSTARRWLQVLSAVYNAAAQDWGYEVENPIRGMPLPRATVEEEHDRQGRVVGDDELEQILAHIPEAGPTTLACIRFLRWSGARRSEALKLDWKDVELDGEIPTATFRGTKDAKQRYRERTIPLHAKAVDALVSVLEGAPKPKEGRVFPLSPDTPTRAFIRGRDRAGVPDVRLHDLRHTRTTEITSVLHPLEAKAVTGHADLRMLDRYYHAEAKTLGRKLMEADAKSVAKPGARGDGSEQIPTEAALEGLSDEQRLKAQLALQLLKEAGVKSL